VSRQRGRVNLSSRFYTREGELRSGGWVESGSSTIDRRIRSTAAAGICYSRISSAMLVFDRRSVAVPAPNSKKSPALRGLSLHDTPTN
jgi:hypothetical protein